MQGSTMNVLNVQWGRAMLDGDFDMVERIDAARERIEALQAQARRPAGCVWAGSDTCRTCPMADTCRMSAGAA